MKMAREVKPITGLEEVGIIEAMCKAKDWNVDEGRAMMNIEYAAKFPNYMSDCPGYCGPVYVVVWGSGPSMVDVFVERDDKIVYQQKEEGV